MKKIFFVLSGVLLLAAACNANQPQTKQNQQTAPSPNQNTTESSVKTYTNTQYGYQFEYPNNWVLSDLGSTIDDVNKILSLVSVSGEGQSFAIRVDQNKPQGFVYQATKKTTVTVNGTKYTAYIFPNGWECYGDTPRDCSTFIIPIQKGNLWYMLSAEGKAASVTESYSSILSSFKFVSP